MELFLVFEAPITFIVDEKVPTYLNVVSCIFFKLGTPTYSEDKPYSL